MPDWNGILAELNQSVQHSGQVDFDGVRRKYLFETFRKTNRNVILYATNWLSPVPGSSPDSYSITDEDLQGLMTVFHGLKGDDVDLILHSPGGSAEAAEAFVKYLRSKFSSVRVVIPHVSMSAATMVACSGNAIAMGKHSFPGPIDPQFIIQTPLGIRMVPAQAILDQFDRAVEECKDPSKMAAWLPMLNQYGPDLLVQCENALERARSLVEGWLSEYMFGKQGKPAGKKATAISEWLANHKIHKSHGRHISRDELQKQGLSIQALEEDEPLQDLFLSIFHATTHTFAGTGAVKIIENHMGHAFIKLFRPTFPSKPPSPSALASPGRL